MIETVVWEEQDGYIGFDYRWKRDDTWGEWFRGYSYVVEPKPGPYEVK